MRQPYVLPAAVAMLIAGGLAREARAGATVDLLFVGVNGAAISATHTVTVAPSAQLTMAVRMRNDVPMTVGIFSLNYDLDGDNELDVVSAFQWLGVPLNKEATDFFDPVTAGLSPTTASFVGSFQGQITNFVGPRVLPPAAGAFAGGYQLGTVVWHVNAGVNDDGADIISGLLNGGDGFFNATFDDMANVVLFNSATVTVPEPGTATLLGLGLVGLVLLGRPWR